MLSRAIVNNFSAMKISVFSANLFKRYLKIDFRTCSSRSIHQIRTLHATSTLEAEQSKKKQIIVESLYGPVDSRPNGNFAENLWKDYERWPSKSMITCAISGRTYDFQTGRLIARVFGSALIAQCGLKKGDILGVLLPNLPEYALAVSGALEAGIIVTFVNPLYTAEEVKRQFEDADVVCCLTIPYFSHVIETIVPQLPAIKTVIMLNPPDEASKELKVNAKILDFKQLLMTQQSPIDLPEVFPEDIAILPYSSGTTGLPKGVILTHHNLVVNWLQVDDLDLLEEGNPDRVYVALNVLPFFHIFGFNGILNLLLNRGAHIVTMPKFTPEDYLAALIKYRPEQIYTVPSLLMFLASHPSVKREHLESVKDIVTGAATTTESVMKKFYEKFPQPDLTVRQGYGMTELSPITLLSSRFVPRDKCASAGRLVKGTRARVVSLTDGEDQPANKPGELLIKGPQMMKGYWKNEEATRNTIDADGWLHTGDVVYYDEEGYFYVIDRTKDLIKVKGNQVSPTELENLIIKIAGVADVAVVGVPNDIDGEIPKAFVVLEKNAQVTAEEIIKYVEPKVVAYKRLKGGVQFVDSIPRNISGKVLRNNLRN